MEKGKIIWTTGDMDSYVDGFRSPMESRDFYAEDGKVEGWPSFHASRADPDGGYRIHRYRIFFPMEDPEDAVLYLRLIASTPRVPMLKMEINGAEGYYDPYPVPSDDPQIKPSHALHAAIYNKEEIRIFLPKHFFRTGENVLGIEALDSANVLKVENEQAVLRLDRMADACGFHYGAFRLECASRGESAAPPRTAVRPLVIYTREADGLMEHCRLVADHAECGMEPEILHLSWKGGERHQQIRWKGGAFGQKTAAFLLPDGEGEVHYRLEGSGKAEGTFFRKRKWKVYTMPHAHTDIGYTHRQWEVAERMCRNLDRAVEILQKRGEYFSYILDGTWQLEAYEHTRSRKRKEALKEQIRKGKIGIPWDYADLLTQFPTLEGLIHNGDYSTRYLERLNLHPERADIVDVASATASYPTVLAGSGVKYLIHAGNQDRGPFRFNGGLHRKSPFWWEGPDGSRVMVWMAKMYCELKKVCGSPLSVEAASRGLEMWLQEYERPDYPADAVMLYGMEADNTDIDVRAPRFYREWKEKVAYPELIPSDGSAFFRSMEPFAAKLPRFRGDEGAYWEDGMASSAAESFAVRRAESGLRAAEILDTLAVLHGPGCRFPQQDYEEAWKQVLLYGEHTWGAFLSGSDPDSLLQKDQWECKRGMAEQAVEKEKQLLTQALAKLSLMWNNDGREIVVYNPYSFPARDLATVEIAAEEEPFRKDGTKTEYEVLSVSKTQKVIRFYTGELEAFSYRRWKLRRESENKRAEPAGRWEKIENREGKSGLTIENKWYRVSVDPARGCLRSWYDKENERELLDTSGSGAGRMLYAQGGEGTTLLGNRDELSRKGVEAVPSFYGQATRVTENRCEKKVEILGTTAHGDCVITMELPLRFREVRMHYDYDKETVYGLEALYVEFPFQISKDSVVLSDSQIGWTDWRKGCLPGACREWLPLQTSVLLQDQGYQIQIISPEAFLFTAGSTVQGRWESGMELDASHIYSYVLNNYWRVNYKGAQGGRLRFHYILTSEKKISPETAYRNGQIKRFGLLAARMSYQEFRTDVPEEWKTEEGQLFEWKSSHIVISTMRGTGDENSILLRLLETGGKSGEVAFRIPGRKVREIYETDLQGRGNKKIGQEEGCGKVRMSPWQVRTVKIIWE